MPRMEWQGNGPLRSWGPAPSCGRQVWRYVRNLRRRGHSHREISKRLRKYFPSVARSETTVRTYLKRMGYTGRIEVLGYRERQRESRLNTLYRAA